MADFFGDIIFPVLLVVTPIAVIFLELYQRSRYPIRAIVRYQIGQEIGGKTSRTKNLGYIDRVGLFYRRDEKGKQQPAPIWKFRSNGKTIQNMSLDLVDEISVPMIAEWIPGRKRIQIVAVDGISGPQGEEFYAMKYDASKETFRPIFSEDWALTFSQIWTSIQERHAQNDFWKTYGVQIILGGLVVVVAGMLLFVALKLGDVAQSINTSTAEVARAREAIENRSQTIANRTTPQMPQLPFIPPT